MESEDSKRTGMEIAVIGMAGRFPGAKHIREFWENLKNGVESIFFLTSRELEEIGLSKTEAENPNYIKTQGGRLEDREYFDASFFGFTPQEAELLNPQVRFFYECAWEALEDSAYNPFLANQVIGIYAGASHAFYWEAISIASGMRENIGEFASSLLTDVNTICTHLSYYLNLKGPAVVVQTACSTSLVAIHLACQALLNGECDMAAAGGVTILGRYPEGYIYQEGMIQSPDGHCRAFDAKAKGMANGEGCAAVVLKQLEYAIEDRDHIYAVIKGTAVNNDGIRKVGYTAPSVVGQAEAIRMALQVAEVEPQSITYVETHGTGTVLGDPIEIKALTRAFNTDKRHYCAIGSVKSNIGHLGCAAGVTGFIKTVLALYHRLLPPSLHYEVPNPGIDFENSPFFVNHRLREWKTTDCPLRGGVSSFGIGGTNAHVILEEAPAVSKSVNQWVNEQRTDGRGGSLYPPLKPREYQLILLSAKTESALEKMTRNLTEHLEKNPHINLADAAYTLQVGRRAFEYRRMMVCSSREQVIERLLAPTPQKRYDGFVPVEAPQVIFVFPGLGGQYVNMGRELYEKEPLFRKEMDCCFEILTSLMDTDIKETLYPRDLVSEQDPQFNRSDRSYMSYKSYKSNINQTDIAQLSVFIFEYALAKLLIKWGIEPNAMIGYSFGEYTAAAVAGVFSLADVLELIVARGQLMKKTSPGMMLSVPLTREELQPALPPGLSLAIDNGPSCVAAGTPEEVSAFEKEMKKRRCMTMRLEASHALHSHLMEPILKEFETVVTGITRHEPVIPYISNVSGDWLKPQEVLNPAYWANHLRKTVRFAEGIQTLLKEPRGVWVEVGPGRDIGALVSRAMEINSKSNSSSHQFNHQRRVINLVKRREKEIPDSYYLLHEIGLLWLLGVSVNWQEYYRPEKRCRLPLPTYPFERHRFWTMVEDFKVGTSELIKGSTVKTPGGSLGMADWFYVPLWKRQKILKLNSSDPVEHAEIGLCWWIFVDDPGLGERLADGLSHGKDRQQHRVITIEIGTAYKKQNSFKYTINPKQYEDYQTLVAELHSQGSIPDRIVHLWGVTDDEPGEIEPRVIEKSYDLGFYSLLYLAKALGRNKNYTREIGINVVTNHMQLVIGQENLSPGKAGVLGPCRVIPQEYPAFTCKSLDVSDWQNQELIQPLLEEMKRQDREPMVAFRGKQRWVQTFEVVHLEKRETLPLLRQKGVYLVIGGLGNIGYTLVEHLILGVQAKIIITGRTDLPLQEMESQESSDETKKIHRHIRKLQHLREIGGDVVYYCADISDASEMKTVIEQAETRFGPLNGVIHSAGVIRGESFKSIHDITGEECQEQFQAKVYGLMVLEELLKGKPLDFAMMISSLSTVLGGLEFVAYSAANHFMDAFAAKHNQEKQVPWIVVDWEGTNKKDTADAFHHIFSSDSLEQVIFSIGGDLKTRISQWVKLENISQQAKEKETKFTPTRSRPELLNPYAAPTNATEQELAHIWQNFFGIDKIGITDDLFDLGGNSLKMITLIAIIQKELKVTIPLKEFFDFPTIESVARYITGAEEEEFISIEPAEKKEYYVLSSAQKRLYILQEMEQSSTAYNSPQVFVLEGSFKRESFQQAVQQLIQRHESLRTSIHMMKSEPVQRVHNAPEVPSAVEFYDVTAEPAPNTRVETLIEDFLRPFGLSRPPFFRLRLVKTGENRYVFMFDIHHIVTDGITHEIFIREFMALYPGKKLPPLCIQYKDYAEWQKGSHRQAVLAQQELFWLTQFQKDNEIPVLLLPYDYPRPVIRDFAGAVKSFQLSGKETRTLRKIAAQESVTLYMVLLTIFYIFLFKLSRQEDIVVGTPVAGRRHAELESIIGVFINTLPIRNHPSPEKSFQDFLQEVKQNTLQAFENQDYPFEDLVDKVVVHRDTGRNPLFDTSFVLQISRNRSIAGMPARESAQVTLTPYDVEHKNSRFDLTLEVIETGESLVLLFEYSTRLFTRETLERFIYYFRKVTTGVIVDAKRKIADIDILSQEEQQQLLYDFNQTAMDYPPDRTIQQIFADRVEKTPGNIALAAQDPGPWAITYNQLNRKANQLAHMLIRRGIQPEAPVGIMGHVSPGIVIVIMAILKAGAAFLPLDLNYPRERKKYILEDSQTNLLFTRGLLIDKKTRELFNLPREDIIPFDDENIYAEEGYDVNPDRVGKLSHLAYVIYTSGTTGMPKGVMIEHRGLLNYITWAANSYVKNERLDFPLYTSISFDLTVTSIFTPLITGNAIRVYPSDPDQVSIEKIIEDNHVGVIKLTPSHLKLIRDKQVPRQVSTKGKKTRGIKRLIVGGEELTTDLARDIYRNFNGNIEIYNEYGPTETVVGCMLHLFDPESDWGASVPLGSPAANTRVYILDENLKPLPYGVAGELCIGGNGVGRGYLNQPGITAEKFDHDLWDYQDYQDKRKKMPGKNHMQSCNHATMQLSPHHLPHHPITSLLHYPIYRTGDLARRLTDGNVEFLGRIDEQVKIRGFRIELGEIENQLLKHTDIKEAVVVCSSDEQGNKSLCAYIVSDRELAVHLIREFLAAALPEYMIPNYFVTMDQIPLTANGKIDRRALPVPEIAPGAEMTRPRNFIEEKLANIWSGVLRVKKEKLGIDANFFELGGHSLNAIILLAGIHRELDLKVPIAKLFQNPTIRGLSGILRELTAEQYEAIEPAEHKAYYTLSSAQRGFYLLQQMDPGNTSFNITTVVVLEEKQDEEKIQAVFREMIHRHEIFRTTFRMIAGEPFQVIHPEVEFNLEYYQGGVRQSAGIDSIIEAFIRPFDLSHFPLLRVGLIETQPDQYVLMLDIHHIVVDGLCLGIMLSEFEKLYAGRKLSPLRMQYKDFSEWQNSEKIRKSLKQQEDYWLNLFKGGVPELNLPLDYVRPTIRCFEGTVTPFEIGPEETGLIKQLARARRTTVYMVILSIFNLLLSRVCNQETIFVGTGAAGRRHPDIQQMIGTFQNMVVLVNDTTGEKTFKEFLKEVNANTLEAFENQEYPFEELVKKVTRTRDASRNPLFDVFLILNNMEAPSLDVAEPAPPPVKMDLYSRKITQTRFDLSLQGTDSGRTLYLAFEYCTKLFKKDTIDRFITYFKAVISSLSENPDIKLTEIDILSEIEKKEILFDFNDTKTNYCRDKTIHRLFEEQVEKTPGNIAVVGPDPDQGHRLVSISYKELNRECNQLAHQLRNRGVGPGRFVGVIMDRSHYMVIGVMAILKAGSTYVPLEPYLPEARIITCLSSLNVEYLLTNRSQLNKIDKVKGKNLELQYIFCLDLDNTRELKEGELSKGDNARVLISRAEIEESPVHNPVPAATASDNAYVIFTSGTTGMPKGVVETHRPVVNLIEWVNKTFHLGAADKLLFIVSLGFDLSVYDIFGILAAGASLRVVGNDDLRLPERLLDMIVKERITFWDSAPAALQILVPYLQDIGEAGDYTDKGKLRLVFLSGDWIPVTMPDILKRAFSGLEVIGLGGATEATVWSNFYPIESVDPGWNSIPYGKPMQNAKYYILNKFFNPCPIGVPGDLFIGGECLASGYANDIELTAQKFLDNPFVIRETIYKTGDLARWFPGGNMEFLGRVDHQVKIRGFRIELGEIEACLSEHPDIKAAVVLARENEAGEKYLCAYFVPGEQLSTVEIKENLLKHLPVYMIPSYFMPMEKIPLTANGKVDRKALPSPEITKSEEYAAPGNEVEKQLVEIWLDLFNLKGAGEKDLPGQLLIGIDDNFFELGGHSLNAAKLITRIHEKLRVKVPLAEIFKTPTIRELSQYITRADKNIYEEIQAVEKREYYPQSSAQQRLFFLDQFEDIGTSYNIPHAFKIWGEVDRHQYEKPFQTLIRRHEALRTSFEIIDGEPVQRIHHQVDFDIEDISPQDQEADDEILQKIIKRFIRPFDLAKAPLLRAGLLRLPGNESLLLFDMHHIISDGVSEAILTREYVQLFLGEEPAPLTVQYKDFSLWQDRLFKSGAIKEQQEYWLNLYRDMDRIPILNLPTDYPRRQVFSFAGAVHRFKLEAADTIKFRALGVEVEATLYMNLLTAFYVLLYKYTGQSDIIVGSGIAGRPHANLENIIGMFVNTLAMRNYPGGEKTYLEFLKEVKENCIKAFENQDMQFEELVDLLSRDRSSAKNPLFSVELNVQNYEQPLSPRASRPAAALGDQSSKPRGKENETGSAARGIAGYEFEHTTSKFDMILFATEVGDEIHFMIEYATALFKPATIKKMARRYVRVIKQVVENKTVKLEDIKVAHDLLAARPVEFQAELQL